MRVLRDSSLSHFLCSFAHCFCHSLSAPCDLSDEEMSVIDSSDHKMHGGGGPLGLHGGSGGGACGGAGGGAHLKKGGDRKSARARTVLSEKQLNILKTCYSANPRPDALMKEQLVEMTGLSPRVIRVWFQNKRCKDKKVQNRLLEKQMQRESVSETKKIRGRTVNDSRSVNKSRNAFLGMLRYLRNKDRHNFPLCGN